MSTDEKPPGEASPPPSAPTPTAPATPAAPAAAAPAGAPPAAARPAAPATPPAAAAPEDPAAKAAAAEAAAAAAKARAEAAAKAKAEEEAKPLWEREPIAPEGKDAMDDPLVGALRDEFGDAIEGARRFAGELTVKVGAAEIARVAASLKTRHGFTFLLDVCGADWPARQPRFDVVYHLYSFAANRRLRVKAGVAEGAEIATVTTVWKAAGWPERETYDMYGIRFAGHPDMTRILLWEGFNGHPLRKDFPVEGIDTGMAIYPEYYEQSAGPVTGTGTGWRPKPPGGVEKKPAPPRPAPAAAPAAAAPAGAPPAASPPPASAPPAPPTTSAGGSESA